MADREVSEFESRLYEKVKGELTSIQGPAMLKDLVHLVRVGLELDREMGGPPSESAKTLD